MLPARLAFAADAPSGSVRRFDAPAVEPGGPGYRVKAVKLGTGDTLVIASPDTALRDTLARLRTVELAVSAAALVVGALLTFAVVTFALAPLRRVEHAAADVSAGDLAVRAGLGPGRSEIAQLGQAFDTMVDRLTTALDERTRAEARVRQFVADGAHELRTPVAAVAAYAELIERGASTRPEDLGRAVRGIRAESARLADLVEDLLVLARLDVGRTDRREPVELVSITAEAVAASNAIGPEWPAVLHADGPVDTMGDADALRRALDNLLANVRTHTPPGTRATVRVSRHDTDRARVVVTDDGPGLAADERERAFERFWRADVSRTRASGGAGLGLAIVAAIIEGHDGRATMPESSGGVTVVLDLPIVPITDD